MTSARGAIVAAPFSLTGSAQRLWRLGIDANPWLRWLLLVPVLLLAITSAWLVIICWYALFGLLLLPYRLIRRGQRRRKVEARRHAEMIQALTER